MVSTFCGTFSTHTKFGVYIFIVSTFCGTFFTHTKLGVYIFGTYNTRNSSKNRLVSRISSKNLRSSKTQGSILSLSRCSLRKSSQYPTDGGLSDVEMSYKRGHENFGDRKAVIARYRVKFSKEIRQNSIV